MKKSDKKMIYSIILGFIILTLLGIAGSYDQKCEQEDAQIQQELKQTDYLITDSLCQEQE